MTGKRRWVRWAAGAGLAVLVMGACDSDGGGSDLAAFCELAEVIDEADEPAASQVREAAGVAPGEIKGDVETLADAFESIEENPEAALEVVGDESVAEAATAVETFLQEECGIDTSDDGETVEEEDVTSDPEEDGDDEAAAGDGDLDEWCRITAEGVTDETADAYVAAAPADIRAETEAFVEATDEDDIEAGSATLLEYAEENCPEGQ